MTFLLDLLVDVSILVWRNKGNLVLIGVARDVGVLWIDIQRAVSILLLKRGARIMVYVIAMAHSVR